MQANPTDRIECFGDQVKLCVKTNSGIFYLILAETSKKKRSDIVQKAKTTLGLLFYTEQGRYIILFKLCCLSKCISTVIFMLPMPFF